MTSTIWKLAEELISAEVLINEYINLQDTLYSEALILTEGLQEGTPRFLVDKFQSGEEENEDGLIACFKSVSYLKKSLGKAMDLETAIVNQYKNFVNRAKSKDDEFKLQRTKKLKKACEDCEEMEGILSSLDEELQSVKKINAGLNNQIAKMQKEVNGYKNMYNELKLSHEEVMKELRNPFQDEIESSRGHKKFKETQDIKQFDKSIAELTHKYESELSKNLKIQNSFQSLLEENDSKQLKLEKAQKIIKKLNEECEKLAKELRKVEEELDFYKKDTKGAEKLVLEARKKFFELEGIKRSEERLREENSAFRQKFIELNESEETERNHLKKVIEELLYDKKCLEKDMEDLEEKLCEIDEMNKSRVQAFNQASEQIKALSEILDKKDKEIENISQEMKFQLGNKENEKEFIKKQAENLIRTLTTGNSKINAEGNVRNNGGDAGRIQNDQPKKQNDFYKSIPENSTMRYENQPSNISQVKLQELENLLQESRKNEENLKSIINRCLDKEKKYQILSEAALAAVSPNFLAKQETICMRLEELESIIQELYGKSQLMSRSISDFIKLVQIKDVQIEEMNQILKELQFQADSRAQNLKDENQYLHEIIRNEILPNSSRLIEQNLDLAHKKIKNESLDCQRLQVDLEDAKSQGSRALYRLEIAQNEICQVSRLLSKYEQEMRTIKSLLNNPSLAINPEYSSSDSQLACEIFQKIKEIFEYNLALIAQRTEARTALEKLEIERQMFVNDLNLTKENLKMKEKLIEEDNIRLKEQNEYLKTCGNKEKEEKNLIQNHWEEEVNFFKAQVEYIKGLLMDVEKEKFKTEAELKQTKSDFAEVVNSLERISNEKNILQKCYEELNSKIWSGSERIRNEWKKDSMMSTGSMFK